ncbi:UPAR/Ly6 domain-containing protein crim [Atheta coriaria]|uniref:UPAR/Ly6 domain-containing protein crim n=1 Tax=Dalotia coriaria TaxID=877792 RepID=UPI0031F36998
MYIKTALISCCLLAFSIKQAYALWCYECVSTQPGCGDPFNWIYLWTNVCKEDNDICVRITERKGSEKVITRACLSSLRGIRTDIPADTYEGCRKAATDVKLGHYVNNSIKELDIHRDYYDDAEFCFCFLDHRCNDSSFISPSLFMVTIGAVAMFVQRIL